MILFFFTLYFSSSSSSHKRERPPTEGALSQKHKRTGGVLQPLFPGPTDRGDGEEGTHQASWLRVQSEDERKTERMQGEKRKVVRTKNAAAARPGARERERTALSPLFSLSPPSLLPLFSLSAFSSLLFYRCTSIMAPASFHLVPLIEAATLLAPLAAAAAAPLAQRSTRTGPTAK